MSSVSPGTHFLTKKKPTEFANTDVDNKKALRKYLKVERQHKQYVWETRVAASKKKVEFLKTKRDQKRQINRERTERRRLDETELINNDPCRTTNNRFYLITDDELITDTRELEHRNYEVYGSITLTKQEEEC